MELLATLLIVLFLNWWQNKARDFSLPYYKRLDKIEYLTENVWLRTRRKLCDQLSTSNADVALSPERLYKVTVKPFKRVK